MNYFNSFIGGAQVINGFMGQGLARQQADLAIQASEMEQSALNIRQIWLGFRLKMY